MYGLGMYGLGTEEATKSISLDILKSIDSNALEELYRKYGELGSNPASKFLKFRLFIPKNVDRAVRLNLHKTTKLRILDIGSGPGYFMLVARHLGHDVVGLDLNENPLYIALTELFSLKVHTGRVRALCPLPIEDGSFDLITSYAVVFNAYSSAEPWRSVEWEAFRIECDNRLRNQGLLRMELNQQRDGRYYSDDLGWYFSKIGYMNGREITIPKASLNTSLNEGTPCWPERPERSIVTQWWRRASGLFRPSRL